MKSISDVIRVSMFVRECVIQMRAGAIKNAGIQQAKAVGALEVGKRLEILTDEQYECGLAWVDAEKDAVALRNTDQRTDRFTKAIRLAAKFDDLTLVDPK